jgi:hypothetical protein
VAVTTTSAKLNAINEAGRQVFGQRVWQEDNMIDRELLRQKAEYYQGLTRAMTGTVTVPTSISRYNKRLLLCQP